ncbi:DUF1080 domain-containing protein [candidate division KSB1 bacterium]|nr:DUF1080 domain-containing protein [candidate division KSB1 bacterium]RQW00149.1 MAG: DUF1080 domain-containing protein [candidate division KSB1 bacterium]
MKRIKFFVFVALVVMVALMMGCSGDGWISLFDGKSLDGWKPVENPDSWKVQDGALVTDGPRSHLFYVGDVHDGKFKNFEFVADVMTRPGSNSGIYVHTEVQEEGWPGKGYECQVINSYPEVKPGEYVERKMTGSIYGVRNVWKAPVPDNEWFHYHIKVQGRTIQTFINGELMAEYTESDDPGLIELMRGRRLDTGTFALQGHDPGSTVFYKNIKVKPLPDDLATPGIPLEDAKYDSLLITLAQKNFPLLDLHVHLKGGLIMEQALAHARQYGFTYGLAVNCGLDMTYETNDALEEFLATYEQPPQTYLAMQAEGREWLDLFATETVAKFDYVFTDAMTWTNNSGKRLRLWIKEETEVGDPQDFMEQLVQSIEQILTEPVDIYVNPTYLPDEIAHLYDDLWTPERMDRVIQALVENKVALEINDRRKIPSADFIKRAKAAGVKFTFGTNNGGIDDLGRLEYCLAMVQECGLQPSDMWHPGDKN